MLTEQGLENSLWAILEFGYKCHERGMNIQAATQQASPMIRDFLKAANLPKEIMRNLIRKKV